MPEAPHRTIHTAIVAPTGRDANLLREACAGVGIEASIALGPGPLSDLLAAGRADLILLTQEALDADLVSVLESAGTKAPWDQLPVLLLVDANSNSLRNMNELERALPDAQLVVLERPLRFPEFHSALDMLRRSRGRQYEVRDLLEQERTLRRELNHRVKNILSTVQALYALSARNADDLEQFAESFGGRLKAMARVHEDLFAKDYADTDVAVLLRGVLEPYRTAAGNLETSGNSVEVTAEAAQNIALCAHELATNAMKHGALSQPDGTVSLRWRTPENRFVFEWIESGGPTVSKPRRSGFGTMFLRSSMAHFGGTCELDFAESGLHATLQVPLHRLRGEVR